MICNLSSNFNLIMCTLFQRRIFEHALKWVFVKNSHRVAESFLSQTSQQYLENLYLSWKKDPKSVDSSLALYFQSLEKGDTQYQATYELPTPKNEMKITEYMQKHNVSSQNLAEKSTAKPLPSPQHSSDLSIPEKSKSSTNTIPAIPDVKPAAMQTNFVLPPLKPFTAAQTGLPEEENIVAHLNVLSLINNYQTKGHLVAATNPLDFIYPNKTQTISERLGRLPEAVIGQVNLQSYMDKTFPLPPQTFIGGGTDTNLPLKEIIRRLELVYCRHIGIEYMHIEDPQKVHWLKERLETPGAGTLSKEDQKLLLKRLIKSIGFEEFLAKKWPTEKRFGLEGCDSLIPCLKQIIDQCSAVGVEEVVIGQAHRGRLNVITNVCQKPLELLLSRFGPLESQDDGTTDVKYHLGACVDRVIRATKKKMRITLLSNASHLESVNTMVLGSTKARQFFNNDKEGKKIVAIQLHGDAANSGQGAVLETVTMAYLPNFTTHGVFHIIVNNQIGFTTNPTSARSFRYATAVNSLVEAPIFHVNNDCPESVNHVSKIAAEWRNTFHKDVVIDIIGYRRHGHNEGDEPRFTQPLMYKKIDKLPSTAKIYAQQLIAQQIIKEDEFNNMVNEYSKFCEGAFERSKQIKLHKNRDWLDHHWKGFFSGKKRESLIEEAKKPTGVSEDVLKHISTAFSSPPPPEQKFVTIKGVDRILKARQKMINSREIDWALGEALGIGSLLKEGIHVRLSGEDVERGTFSHRHHILHHKDLPDTTYNMLHNLYPNQGHYTVCNSCLSEYGVLGFEHGYSLVNPKSLVIWEAQFGDFVNGAQIVIDQYLSSGQAKWARQSGLVVLLPHGMEGMGPEHSSARMERFLQMSDDDCDSTPKLTKDLPYQQLYDCNWIIVNCSTPANVFHAWRRQVHLPFRKPLIHISVKSILRHPHAKSSFDEMLEGTSFKRIIPNTGESSKNPENVKKMLFCSGKVFYDIQNAIASKNLTKDIAVCRVEQLFPFPYDLLCDEIKKYKNAHLCWCQEEPKNSGPYQFVAPRFRNISDGRCFEYIGRDPAAAPATGLKVNYEKQFKKLFENVTKI